MPYTPFNFGPEISLNRKGSGSATPVTIDMRMLAERNSERSTTSNVSSAGSARGNTGLQPVQSIRRSDSAIGVRPFTGNLDGRETLQPLGRGLIEEQEDYWDVEKRSITITTRQYGGGNENPLNPYSEVEETIELPPTPGTRGYKQPVSFREQEWYDPGGGGGGGWGGGGRRDRDRDHFDDPRPSGRRAYQRRSLWAEPMFAPCKGPGGRSLPGCCSQEARDRALKAIDMMFEGPYDRYGYPLYTNREYFGELLECLQREIPNVRISCEEPDADVPVLMRLDKKDPFAISNYDEWRNEILNGTPPTIYWDASSLDSFELILGLLHLCIEDGDTPPIVTAAILADLIPSQEAVNETAKHHRKLSPNQTVKDINDQFSSWKLCTSEIIINGIPFPVTWPTPSDCP